MKGRAFGLLVAFALTVPAGCGSAGAPEVRPGPGKVLATAPVDLASGLAEVSLPLSPRQVPLVVAAGDRVVVYGGYRIVGDAHESLGDGAVYELGSGAWREMAPGPFSKPLYSAIGAWTGSEVVVVGTPCGRTGARDIYDATCSTGRVEMAAYSPERNAWRRVEIDIPAHDAVSKRFAAQRGYRYPLLGGALGWTGREMVVQVDSGDGPLLLVDPSTGVARLVPRLENADNVCVVGDEVLATRTGQVMGGSRASPNPEAVAAPLDVLTLGPDDVGWQPVDTAAKPASTGAMFELVFCSAGQMAYFPVMPPPVGYDAGGLWWDMAHREWVQVPPFGPQGFPGGASIAEVAGTRVVALADALFVLPPGAATWTRAAVPPHRGIIQPMSSALLFDAVTGQNEPAGFGILDPLRYAQAHATEG